MIKYEMLDVCNKKIENWDGYDLPAFATTFGNDEVDAMIDWMNGECPCDIGTDYFDGSINRVAATVIGARNARKALLYALLQPPKELLQAEAEGNMTKRLALLEEAKALPFGIVLEMFCKQENVPYANWVKGL